MFFLNLDSVPIHVSAIAAIENISSPAEQKRFPGLIAKRLKNRSAPWYAGIPFYSDADTYARVQTGVQRVNFLKDISSKQLVIQPSSVVANTVSYSAKTSFGSTLNLPTKTYNFMIPDKVIKVGIVPGQAGDQYDFRTCVAALAITYGDPSLITRFRQNLCDFYRPMHFYDVNGNPIDTSGPTSPVSFYNGSYMYINNQGGQFPAQRIPSVSAEAVLNKTFNPNGFTGSNGSMRSGRTLVQRTTFSPETVTLNGVTFNTSTLISASRMRGTNGGLDEGQTDEYKNSRWTYYNDQHPSNFALTTYVVLTGDYMAEDEFEFVANMELGVYKPWTGLLNGLRDANAQFPYGFGNFPGGGEREYGRRMLLYTNALCVTKPPVANKFYELSKVLSDRIENYFRQNTNNYQDITKLCLQIGTDGGSNSNNPIYTTFTSGHGIELSRCLARDGAGNCISSETYVQPVSIWLPWQMSYAIRGLYAFTKYDNDSKYRDLLLRLCRTMFLFGIFKEPEGYLPAGRPGPAGDPINWQTNRLYPNIWKTISYIRKTGNFTPLDASCYYEAERLKLTDYRSNGDWDSRYRCNTNQPGLGFANWKGTGTVTYGSIVCNTEVSAALSGNDIVSGISTGASGTCLTDFNRDMLLVDYHEWYLGAAQIAASIIKDSDEAGERSTSMTRVLEARQNAREYLRWYFNVNPRTEISNNVKFSRVNNWLARMYNPMTLTDYACYTPIPLTDANQYPLPTGGGGTGGGGTGGGGVVNQPTGAGFTTFTPSVDSRVVYVSTSTGNDANDGLSESTPKRTIAAGYDLMRDGYPDWLLLKRGDIFHYNGTQGVSGLSLTGAGSNLVKAGRSNEERMLIGAYGPDVSARPRIVMFGRSSILSKFAPASNAQKLGADSQFTRNLNIVSIEFTSEHFPSFVGQGIGTNNEQQTALGFIHGARNVLIEDCYIHDIHNAIELSNFGQIYPSYTDPEQVYQPYLGFSENVKIYRCSFDNIFAAYGSHTVTIFCDRTLGLVIEECVFDSNQYHETIPNIQADVRSHHIYCSEFCVASRVEKCVISRSSAQGVKQTNGGIANKNLIMKALIGIAQCGCNNIKNRLNDVGQGALIPQRCGDYQRLSVNNDALQNVILEPRDLRNVVTNTVQTPHGFAIWRDGGSSGRIQENIMIQPSDAYQPVGGGMAISIRSEYRLSSTVVSDNIIWNYSGTTGDGTQIFLQQLLKSDNLQFLRNIAQVSGTLPNPNRMRTIYLADASNTANNNLVFEGNILTPGQLWGSFASPQAYLTALGSNPAQIARYSNFPDPHRTITTYQSSLEAPSGGLSHYNFFMKKCVENRKGAWDPRYTAVAAVNYFREGFGLNQITY